MKLMLGRTAPITKGSVATARPAGVARAWPRGATDAGAIRERVGARDGAVVLHGEDIGDLAVVALRPEVAARSHVIELGRDANAIAALASRAASMRPAAR